MRDTAPARIDAHQHFWRYSPDDYGWIGEGMDAIARDFLPADLAVEMDAVGINASIAVQARQSDAETDWLLKLARDNDRIAGVVGWVDLRSPVLGERLEALSVEPKLKGFRHVIQDEPDPDFMLRPEFIAGVRQALAAGFAYDILVFARQADRVPQFLESCGEGRFILDHIAKPDIAGGTGFADWESAIRRIAEYPSCYCKVSGMVTEADLAGWSPDTFARYLDVVFEAFGTDRIMFGSDWPVCLLAGSYSQVHGIVADRVESLGVDARDAVLGASATRAYAI